MISVRCMGITVHGDDEVVCIANSYTLWLANYHKTLSCSTV